MWRVVLFGLLVTGVFASPFVVLNPTDFRSFLGQDFDWATDNVPFFDIDDEDILAAYYFRWQLFRQHVVSTPDDGIVLTEFLPDVPWAGKDNTIPCAAGHHIMEGRWLRTHEIVNEYSTFWFERGGNPRGYTFWAAFAAYQRYLVNGDREFAIAILPELVENYHGWEREHLVTYGQEGEKCFWQNDAADGGECSISGNGCRPILNSMMCAEAQALGQISVLANNSGQADEFFAKAEGIRRFVLESLWSPELNYFVTMRTVAVPSSFDADVNGGPQYTRAPEDECPPLYGGDSLVDVRELLGYTPWYFGVVPADNHSFEVAWEQLFSEEGFSAKWGPRTAELRHRCYNSSQICPGHECDWDAPSWPYETSRVITSMANLLNDYPGQQAVTVTDFHNLLAQFARVHTQTTAVNATISRATPGIFEDLHPDHGYWVARSILYGMGRDDRNRGVDYFHSTFNDLVLSGLVGVRVADDSTLVVNPLVPSTAVAYFAADAILVRGHHVCVVWDRDGSRYSRGVGLKVWVDGSLAAESSTLAPLALNLNRL